MDARPFLAILARLLDEHALEAVLIGNAAAALHGAPVTTVDLDFFFRKTPSNVQKLKAIARALGATILTPFYPASGLLRIMRDQDLLQIDFMPRAHGVRSFEGLRSRAVRLDFGGHTLLVAGLPDIIKSKRAAGRESDLAVLELLEKTLDAQKKADPGGAA